MTSSSIMYITGISILALVVAALLALDRLAVWMERRGWIYWRKRPPAGGGMSAGVLTEFQKIVDPQVRHVIEDRQERHAARADRPAGPAEP